MKHYNQPYTYGIPNRSIHLYNFKDKERSVRKYGQYMLNRTQQIFKWSGLPDTIPQRNLEQLLQTCGHCVIVKDKENQYAVIGGFGGEPNVYYEPTKYIVANPALPNLKQEWTINEDCILIRNDAQLIGLNPLISRYCTLLVENDISFRLANINTRLSILISAQDDRTAKSARKYLIDLENGEQGIISSSAFFEGLQTENTTRGYSGTLKDLIEYHQYIRASLYNELGLDANYNMKRTVVNKAEIEANEDALFPLVDDMLYQRQQAAELWNKLYNMNISVEFNSVWDMNHMNEDLAAQQIIAEIENLNADTENIQADTQDISSNDTDESQLNNSTRLENDTSELNNEDSNDNEKINNDSDNNNTNNDSDNSNENDTSQLTNEINIEIEIDKEGEDNVLDATESADSINESENKETMEELDE